MSELIPRRHFIAAAAGVCASAGAVDACWRRRVRCQPIHPCRPCPQLPPAPDTGLRSRPNIASLSSSQLASLRRGVSVMKRLPAADRRSWTFQAAMHGTNDPQADDPLFNQCEHGTAQFLTWHRAYLHFFERILRWAANDPGLNLPYWDWSTQPVLPEPFRYPADPITNPLYEPKRKANDGSALVPQVVTTDLNNALALTGFAASGGTGFSFALEGSPHGQVHVLVGGQGGLMSSVPTAAGDPIFWLHHCNIDRLWNVWLNQAGGRANPSDPTYLDQSYTFADETGGTTTVKVRDVIRSAGLGYRYDAIPNPPDRLTISEQKTTGAAPRVVATSLANERAAPLEKIEAKPLGFKEERVKLSTIKEKSPALLEALPVRGSGTSPPRITILIEGLSADESPEFVYGVYVNLPEGERREGERSQCYVGSINFFGKTRADMKHGHAHASSGFTATFDATAVITRQQRAKKLDPDALTVTLLPLAATPPGVAAAQVEARSTKAAKRANVTYKRITVQITPGTK